MNTLYRFFDEQDDLLYVGRTVNPPSRIRDHAKTKSWWAEVVRIDLENYPDAESLDAAERTAIALEAPRYNIAFNEPPVPHVSNHQKRETLEHFGWICLSNQGAGTFVRPTRPSAFHTRAAAWENLHR